MAVQLFKLVLYRERDVEARLASISEADAARWTLAFATASFGDALLASAVVLLLLPQMPQVVQVRWSCHRLLLPSVCAPSTRASWKC
jgi:hypothetical protein